MMLKSVYNLVVLSCVCNSLLFSKKFYAKIITSSSSSTKISASGKDGQQTGTRAVHAGSEPELSAWGVVPAISLSTTFTQV
jgi:hypothetical protein